MGISCHSSHSQRLWHRPVVETSNAEAHADMYINDYDCIEANDGCQQTTCRILHTHGRHCCFDFDNCFGTARFLRVKLKASSNVFPIYRFPSRSLHPWASALLRPDGSKPAKPERIRKHCKDTHFFVNCIALFKKRA